MNNELNNFSAVTSLDELKIMADQLSSSDALIGFDLETGYYGPKHSDRALNMYHPSQFICGFSITNSTEWARYVPIQHDHYDNVDPVEAWNIMRPVLENKTLVCHNIAFEAECLSMLPKMKQGDPIRINVAKSHDTQIQAYVLSDVPKIAVSPYFYLHEFYDEEGSQVIPDHLLIKCESCGNLTLKHRAARIDNLCENCVSLSEKEFKEAMVDAPVAWNVGLKALSHFRLDYQQAKIQTLFPDYDPAKKRQTIDIRFNGLPVSPQVISYACDDAVQALKLHEQQYPRLSKVKGVNLESAYRLDMAIAGVLVDMRNQGISVDWDFVKAQESYGKDFYNRMLDKTRELFEEESGKPLTDLNFKSPSQMRKLLFDDLKLESSVSTDSGQKSTSEKALSVLRKESDAVDYLLLARRAAKAVSHFEGWSKLEHEAFDGKIHPSFNQTVVPTGRFSCSGPNVQQVSKEVAFKLDSRDIGEVMAEDTGLVWKCNPRSAIIPSPGYYLLNFDFQAAQMRIMAGFAQEEALLDAFREGKDVHLRAASLAFKVPEDQVTATQRQQAKTVGFALLFGQGPQALAEGLGISRNEAQDIQAKYLDGLPKVRQWIHSVQEQIIGEKVIHLPLGNRIVSWESFHVLEGVRNKANRTAVNYPIQGTEATYVKLGMARAAEALKEKNWWGDKVRLIMNQHDSLVFEVHNDLDSQDVIDVLTPAVQFPIANLPGLKSLPTMEIDWEIGHDWGNHLVSIEDSWMLTADKAVLRPSEGLTGNRLRGILFKIAPYKGGDTPIFIELDGNLVPLGKVYLNSSLAAKMKKEGVKVSAS